MGSAFLEDPGVDEFLGFNMAELGVDEAHFEVVSESSEPLNLYTLSSDCYGVSLECESSGHGVGCSKHL